MARLLKFYFLAVQYLVRKKMQENILKLKNNKRGQNKLIKAKTFKKTCIEIS